MTGPDPAEPTAPKPPRWAFFRGEGQPATADVLSDFPPPAPPWRDFGKRRTEPPWDPPATAPDGPDVRRGRTYRATGSDVAEAVNAAIHLRRPLLVAGPPGSGKSSLAYAIAYELGLGPVLTWPISSRSTRVEGLYRYDAVGRLQAAGLAQARPQEDRLAKIADDPGYFLQLGPLGTALLPWNRPRVLLIDEFDKCDVDLPGDLLTLFEDGEFEVPELARMAQWKPRVEIPYVGSESSPGRPRAEIVGGQVACREFPIVVLTSNGEREFPPAFYRRCLRLDLKRPEGNQLLRIVRAHFFPNDAGEGPLPAPYQAILDEFLARCERKKGDELATDQLLNALRILVEVKSGAGPAADPTLLRILLRPLNS